MAAIQRSRVLRKTEKLFIKKFDGKEVLKDISATFDAGKTNLIIGQSGAGKTVFLKSLTGLITPDAGDILYGGMSYNAMSEDEKNNLRHEIGMVFQGGALFDSMDVEENVMFPLMMFSAMSRSEMRDRVDWALRRVNPGKSNLPFELRRKAGDCSRVTAGPIDLI